MKCPKCQAENSQERKFCRTCGVKLVVPCPQCGFENLSGDQFCGGCGHPLSTPTPPPLDLTTPHSYTPKFLADKILTTRSSVEGERKLVTVLFADVANFTSISEKLDPEEIHQIMDGCFKILMDEIHKYEGTINQFTGDGVMALFGAPLAHEDHAQRACYAALAIQNSLVRHGHRLKEECAIDFAMRMGLNSGQVVVGAIGDDLRMDYTAIGDTINLASRMESAAQPGAILVSSHTHKLTKDFFTFTSLGELPMKGKEEPQEAFVLLAPSEVRTRIEASASSGLTRFVGRSKEMETLSEALNKACSGSGQVVGIVGEAGVGKSRIILELKRLYPGYPFLEGQCLHYGGSMAYLPLLDILRSYFEIKEGEREYLINKKMKEKLSSLDEKLLAPFQDLLSLDTPSEYRGLEPKQKQERIYEALRDLLIRESEKHPLVLIIEDLHWIDKTSEEFLDYLVDWLANTPILLILLYRPEYTHRWGSKSSYTNIRVDQLPLPTSAELVQSILGEGQMVPELKNLILGKAAGNPLFMEELTHSLLENGSIQRKEGHYVLSGKPSDIQVPDTVQGIIAARIDRLDESLKRIMHVASVIGREFAFRILQAITEMREELKAHLLNLQGLEFIYEKRLFPELEYVFKHALTQEVAYNSLLLTRRKEIHGKIGHAIEEIYSDRLEEFYEMLAYHYSRSTDLAKGVEYGEKAASRASSTYAYAEAARLLEEALKTQEILDPADKGKRCDLLLDYADALMKSGEPRRALDTAIAEAFSIAENIADGTRASLACQCAMRALLYGPSVSMEGLGTPEAAQWVHRADKYALPNTVHRVFADSAKGCLKCVRGIFTGESSAMTEGIRLFYGAMELARRLGDTSAFEMAVSLWLVFVRAPQHFEERLRLAEDLVKTSYTQSAIRGMYAAPWLLADVFFASGMREQAEEYCRELKRTASRTGQVHALLYSMAGDSVLATMDGNVEEAAAMSSRMREHGRDLGTAEFGAVAASLCGVTPFLLLGKTAEAYDIAVAHKSTLLAHIGKDAEAWELLDKWVVGRPGIGSEDDENGATLDTALLEAAALVRHRKAAELLLNRLSGAGAYGIFINRQTCIGRHLGAAAVFLGKPEEARTYYGQAMDLATKLRFRPEIALIRLQLAELLLDHYPAEREAAMEHLDFAIAEFREMKMKPSLERALRHKEILKA
jgi:class 3 adenylate cyclase/tetratricopeptide (TPR) repeat protein